MPKKSLFLIDKRFNKSFEKKMPLISDETKQQHNIVSHFLVSVHIRMTESND